MTNINQTVWRLITQDASITMSLRRDMLNIRALALYLIKKHHLDASVDAVISAIRRYPMEKSVAESEERLSEIFKNSIIFTKSNMACITVEADGIRNLIANFGEHGAHKNFRLIRGKKYTKVIVNESDLDIFKRYLKKEDIIDIKKGLGEVRIVLHEGSENMRGILAKITGAIALHEISISEFIMCFPDVLIYIHQKDLLRTHQAVLSVQEE